MSIQTELTRITNDKNTIRTKLTNLGLATVADNLDTLASAVNGIVDRGTPDAEVKEGESYTIEAGYYKGGTVRGVSGGGDYELQTKTGVTPTKQAQSITPDAGYYGLASVAVDPIPDAYQDVTSVTATANDVLATKTIVTADGTLTAGTMMNNGAFTRTLDTTTTSVSVPAGYHNGSGTVSLTTEEKTVTPTENEQTVTPTTGKVLSEVTVNPIPSNYVDIDDYEETNALASQVLVNKTAYAKDDVDGFTEIIGTMPDNGAQNATLTTVVSSKVIPAGYTSGGIVDVSNEAKTVTPTESSQTITGTSNKFLTSVTVNPIPAKYGDTTNADAVAANILATKKAVVNDNEEAVLVTGTMPNNGAVSGTIDGLTTTTYNISAGYTTGGIVSLTSDIEEALALI